ncbi:aminotransferase class V-fold PLP-dependent enzyme [Glaciecola sp. MH2013]|nr:aminotransferase class V-fold PLP-dependent enzyme [Glaciecola sp. MH2013]
MGVYALSHSVGPLPRVCKEALNAHYFDKWETLGGDAWPEWLANIDDFCTSLGKLINASADQICPQVNLASGFSSYLSAIAKLAEHSTKRVVLMNEDAFASMGFVVSGLAQSHGLILELISADPNDESAWHSRLCQGDVLACLFTHVHSNTSIKSDIAKLIPLAQESDAFALVDIAQSVGVVPVDVSAWGADAVFGSCVKWLCGGPGAGFMYVKKDDIESLEPDLTAWFSHANPFEFDITHYKPANSAKRFWGGTPSIASYICANASINIFLSIGIGKIAAHNLALKRYLLTQLAGASELTIAPTHEQILSQGGSICVGAKNMEATAHRLQQAGVRFDQRGNIFRISLHIMNTEADADIIASCFHL